MKRIIVVALAALALIFATSTGASAHFNCTGTCNTTHQYGPVGIGIYDYAGDANWKWILPPGGYRTDGPPLYQRDVEGLYVGPGYCLQVWQSNDNYNYGYWGSARGPYKLVTTYWAFNRANIFAC